MLFGDTPDTVTYTEVLSDLRHLNFSNFDGTRTPGAPAFWLLLGSNRTLIALGTSLLVVAGGLVMWRCVTDATRSWRWGLAAGLAYTAWPYLLDAERVMLTESLATFLTTTAIPLGAVVFTRIQQHQRCTWPAILLGLDLGWLVLVRPAALASIVGIGALIGVQALRAARRHHLRALVTTAAMLLPVMLAYGGWLGFMHHEVGIYQPSTLTGYTLSDVTCRSIDHADPRDRDLEERLAPVVHRLLRRHGSLFRSCGGAAYRANFDHIDGIAHPTDAQVSQRLKTMSIRLIERDPVGVATAVSTQAVVQWLGLGYRPAGGMRPGFKWLADPFSAAEIASQVALNGAFLLATAWWVASRWRRRGGHASTGYDLGPAGAVAMTIVWANAISNPLLATWLIARFLVPVIPAMLVVVAIAGKQFRATRAARSSAEFV
jgi:hypothetical protein